MPPRYYMVTAVVLGVLVVVSFPLTMGFSIILWYWLFGAAACILATAGVIKIAYGLRVSPWIGVALASPGFIWAADSLIGLMSQMPVSVILTFSTATSLAHLAAAAAALRLVETMLGPHPAFRVGYGLLAAAALLAGVGFVARNMDWSFTRSSSYFMIARAVSVAAALVKYGAIVGAAVLITTRHDIERWAGAAISLVSAYMVYNLVRSMLVVEFPSSLAFWLQPVLMLVGGAAVWRMGSVLCAQARRELYAQS